MATATEHISIRLPKHIVDQLRKDAEQHQRSLSWMIGYRLAQLNTQVDDQLAEMLIRAEEIRQELPDLVPRSAFKSCGLCGGLNGMHQRGCKR